MPASDRGPHLGFGKGMRHRLAPSSPCRRSFPPCHRGAVPRHLLTLSAWHVPCGPYNALQLQRELSLGDPVCRCSVRLSPASRLRGQRRHFARRRLSRLSSLAPSATSTAPTHLSTLPKVYPMDGPPSTLHWRECVSVQCHIPRFPTASTVHRPPSGPCISGRSRGTPDARGSGRPLL